MNLLLIDIGGTEIKLGKLEDLNLTPLPGLPSLANQGGPALIDRLAKHLEPYLSGSEGIGIATAGQVDPVNGSIRYANPNIPNYTGFPLKDFFEDSFDLPTNVENDVNAAALGELHFGAGKDLSDFLMLTIGTGIGGAIIQDGELHRGTYGGAGEFGHLITHAEDRIGTSDKMAGCYERYASTSALVGLASHQDPELVDGRKVFAKFEDPVIRKVIDHWIEEMATGLVSLIYTFGPRTILFGGGIMREPYILATLQEILGRSVFPSFLPVDLLPAELGNSANLWGAAVPFLSNSGPSRP